MKRPDGFDRRPATDTPAKNGSDRTPSRQSGLLTAPRAEPDPAAKNESVAGARANRNRTPVRPAPPSITSATSPDKSSPDKTAPDKTAPGKPAADKRTAESPSAGRAFNETLDAEVRRAQRERRRYERGEVKRFTRRSRRRKMLWLIALGVAVALVGGAILVAFSPAMAVQSITVEGTQRLSAAEIESALKNQLGKPLPLVSQSAIRTDLDHFTLIRSYSTESLPPGRLVVRIVERQPVAVVQHGKRYALVDPAGVTISSGSTRPAGYPLLTVPGNVEGAAYRRGFTAAVSVVQALPTAILAQVDTVTARTEDDVTLTLGKGSPTVVWGSASDSDLKAAALERLMALPGANRVTEYDVSSPTNVVTR